jgi:hypothetical protein
MRTATVAELALLESGRYVTKLYVELTNQLGAWQDMGTLNGRDFVLGANWRDTLDTPVMSGTVTLARSVGGQSLAATMTASPINQSGGSYAAFIRGGQNVRISTACVAPGVAPLAADKKEVFLGRVDDPSWGDTPNVMTLAVSDIGAWLQSTMIQVERVYSTADGVPVETVMQQILDDNPIPELGPIALYTPVSPNWNIKAYTQARVSVLDALRALAQQIGWDVRYRYDAAGVFRLTFAEPDRAKSVADDTFGPTEYINIPLLSENTDDIKNKVRVYYNDVATGTREFAEYDVPSSIALYGERYMEIGEAATSNIDTYDEALAMATAMATDLALPLFTQNVDRLYYWPAQLGDLYAFTTNGVLYDSTQSLAVVSIEHNLTRDQRRTTLGVRGKPAGAYAAWLLLANDNVPLPIDVVVDTRALALKNFRELRRTPNVVTYGWDAVTDDQGIAEIWGWGKLSPQDADPPLPSSANDDRLWRDVVNSAPDLRLDPATTTFDVQVPPFGDIQTWELQPIAADTSRGFSQRIKVLSTPDVPRITSMESVLGVTGLFRQISALNVVDPQALGGTLKAWLNVASTADADPTAPPDGTLTLVTTPHTVLAEDAWTVTGGTAPLFDAVRIHPGAGKHIYFEFINTNGISSGLVSFVLLGTGGVSDASGNLINGAVNNAAQIAAAFSLPSVYTTLPASGRPNELALQTSDMRLYRWNGSVWTAEVQAASVSGTLTAAQLAAHIIDITKVATSLAPPEVLASLPSSPGAGRTALYAGELYRSTPDGAGWTKAVQTVDLTGTIASAQVADAAITAAKLGAAAVQTANIAAAAITNALIAASAVTTTSIADGAISTPKIIAGAVTATQIAANTITATQIAALTITAAQIASGTITTVQIAALTIVAGNIASGTITATQLAADSVTATQLAANSVVAGDLTANAVTAGTVAAGVINTTQLAAGAVTANELGANAVTAVKILAGAVTTTSMAANTINGDRITAGTLDASKIVANSIVAGQIAAGAITATAIAAGAVDATKLSTIILSETAPNAGIIQIGKLRSADGLRYLDLAATGSNPFLHTPTLDLRADGSATFSGTVASSSFTTGLASFSGAASFFGAVSIFASGSPPNAINMYDTTTGLQSQFYTDLVTDRLLIWSRHSTELHTDTGAISMYPNQLFYAESRTVINRLSGQAGAAYALAVQIDGADLFRVATAGVVSGTDTTSIWLIHAVSGGASTLKQVLVDAANSAGSGYRGLRVVN